MNKIKIELEKKELSKIISCLRREKDSIVSEIIHLDSTKEKFPMIDVSDDCKYQISQRDEIMSILEKLTNKINK